MQVHALCHACAGTLWLLGLRNKLGAKGQEPRLLLLPLRAVPCPQPEGCPQLGTCTRTFHNRRKRKTKSQGISVPIALHSVLAMAPPVTTGNAREGCARSGPGQQAREQLQSLPGP